MEEAAGKYAGLDFRLLFWNKVLKFYELRIPFVSFDLVLLS
jgi:hypothetical protein